MIEQALPSAGIVIVYDGDCPLCQAYVRRLRLKETAGSVRLMDARRGRRALLQLLGWPLLAAEARASRPS
jgi:predicted DCC family thiol-disulfide oxidoreductase YuxK